MRPERRAAPVSLLQERYRPFFPESPGRELTWRGLTSKQNTITNLMLFGLTNPEISLRLNMIPQVVKNNVCQIYKKLGVHNRSHLLVRVARESQLLHFSQPDTEVPVRARSSREDHSCDPMTTTGSQASTVEAVA